MDQRTDAGQFIELYSAHEVRLRGYVLSLVPRWSDAEDIVQKCSLVFVEEVRGVRTGNQLFCLGLPDRPL